MISLIYIFNEHFFYFMDILEEKKHIYIYKYIDFQTCMY